MMKSIRTGAVALAGVLAMLVTSPAFACSPLPPPPAPPLPAGASQADAAAWGLAWNQVQWRLASEQERARLLKQQSDLFEKASGIAIMRLDRDGRTSGAPAEFAHMNGLPLVILKPVRWVKGADMAGELQIAQNPQAVCGMMAAADALRGKPGDVFLVYLSGTSLQQTEVMEGFSLDRIIEARTLAALTKPGG